MSEVITFNTEELAKNPITSIQPKTFELMHESHPLISQVLSEFDFKNPPVDPNEFASTLVETCKLHHGIGLSANQCGFPYRVFVMGTGDDYVAFFNPKIIMSSEETSHGIEGCLSFPFLGLRITRPEQISVEYQSYTGELKFATFTGLTSRCFQHELDHMNGVTFTKKAKPLALKSGLDKRNKLIKKLRLK